MSLINMESDVNATVDSLREWRNSTSQHVRQYWSLFNETTPFFVARVVTTFLSERRISMESQNRFNLNSVSDDTNVALPDRLEILYMQDITYLERSTGDPSFFNFAVSNLFTIPFDQDGATYTKALRSTSNNSLVIFLEYTGVVPDDETTTPVLNDPRNRNVIVIVVSVVTVAVLAASFYIYFLIRLKELDQRTTSGTGLNGAELAGGETTVIPAIIGVNTNENVIVSESYDEDYTDSSFFRSPNNPVITSVNNANTHEPRPSNVLDVPVGPAPSSNGPVGSALQQPMNMDSSSPLRIAATNSREFDISGSFILNPNDHQASSTQPHQLPSPLEMSLGTPNRYGTMSMLPVTVSDLDNGEMATTVDNYFNYSPISTFRTGMASPPSPLMIGLNGGDVEEMDNNYESNNDGDINDDNEDSLDDRNAPFMTGFQLEIEDLE
jgi:hypothetical protein